VTGNFNLELSIKNDQAGSTALDGNMPTIILANATNDWGGNLTIGNGRIRVGGTGEVIPHGAGKGNVVLLGEGTAAARPTILTVDGLTETVNGLSSSGTESETFVTNQAVADGTIRIGANNATSTFGGTLTDTPGFGKLNVTKIGSGAFTSTGANAYTGDTRVEGGVFSITNGTLADTADVYLSTGAIFNLNFTGTDTIDSLFFNGAGQATGTWGSLASTAAHKSALFTGLGLLDVQTVGVGPIPGDFDHNNVVDSADLTKWRMDFGAGAGSDADSDGDSDGNDFLIWQRNLGMQNPAVAAGGAVPEPTAGALVGLAMLGLRGRRRTRG
jgi:autotransporter-associated beta strand protein